MYKVTKDSPEILSPSNQTISPRGIVVLHDLSNQSYTIDGPVAKVSLYNAKNLTLLLTPQARILTSLMEISHCSNLTITFLGPVPAITQIDPEIDGLKFKFGKDSEPKSFVVAPRPPSVTAQEGLGLKNITIYLTSVLFHEDEPSGREQIMEQQYIFVNNDGGIAPPLLKDVTKGDKVTIAAQYKISKLEEGGWPWKMEVMESADGIPVVGGA